MLLTVFLKILDTSSDFSQNFILMFFKILLKISQNFPENR